MCSRTLINQSFLLLLQVSVLLSGCGGPAGNSAQISHTERQTVNHDGRDHDGDHDDHGDHDHHIADHRPDSYADLVHQLELRPSLIHAEANDDISHAAHELEELLDIIAWLPEIAADTDLVKRDWDDANRIAGELAGLVPAQTRMFVDRMKPGSDIATEYELRVNKLSKLIPLAVQN